MGVVEKKRGEGKDMCFHCSQSPWQTCGTGRDWWDMRGAALESTARSLRCSEGVTGCLLFLSSPLPGVFSGSRQAYKLFLLISSLREPQHEWQVQEKGRDYREEKEWSKNGRDGHRWPMKAGCKRWILASLKFIWRHFWVGSFSTQNHVIQNEYTRHFNGVLHCQKCRDTKIRYRVRYGAKPAASTHCYNSLHTSGLSKFLSDYRNNY